MDFRRSLSRSLAFKVGALTVVVMLVVLAVFSAAFVVSQEQKEEADILENGKTFSRFAADSIYDDYVQFYSQPRPEEFEQFKMRIKDTLAKNRDIRQVMLITINGRILFDSTELTDGKYTGSVRKVSDERTLDAARSKELTTRQADIKNAKHTEIVMPLIEPSGAHVLSMRYILSYEALSERMMDIYQRAAAVSLLLMAFVFIIAVFFARNLSKPIIQLTAVATRIRSGDLSARSKLNRADEIGELAHTLNDMAEKLSGYYKNLETRVNERTKELQATQAQLLQNVRQDEALLASIGDGVIATDKSGHIIWMNSAAEDMLQVTKEEVLGRSYETIWQLETDSGDAVPKHDQPIYQAFQTGRPIRDSKYYYARKDTGGKDRVRFAVAVTIAPVILNEQVVGVVNVFRDITHERDVDRMKTEFISLASHQLRTPLSAIRWFTEMLLGGDAGKLSQEQEEFAKNIYDSATRMIDLVNGLLNISRIESGRIIVDPRPTDLHELVNGVVNDVKAKMEERQQTLVVSIHKDLPKIDLDAHLIGQVYMNFLTNAIKYTPKGGEISIFISRKDGELVSQISDNGYGIPKSQQGRVFQKFFRAENVIKVETDGTGLGLYMVKAIIESSGGRVWFESTEGKGTTFWFALPMSGMVAKKGEVTLDA